MNEMNEMSYLPELEKIKQTVAKSRRRREEMELAGLELESVIVMLEQENQKRRIKHLKRVLQGEEAR